jgi:hypothetical protein
MVNHPEVSTWKSWEKKARAFVAGIARTSISTANADRLFMALPLPLRQADIA